MNELKVENFGPIGKAHVEFGDLTILVGAQASGKSLFLELLKLLEDKEAIVETLRKYNYIISKSNVSYLLEAYFGNGMAGAENGGYPPTQNGDIRSLFWLFSLMALQN